MELRPQWSARGELPAAVLSLGRQNIMVNRKLQVRFCLLASDFRLFGARLGQFRPGLCLLGAGFCLFSASLRLLGPSLSLFGARLGLLRPRFSLFGAKLGLLDAGFGVFDADLLRGNFCCLSHKKYFPLAEPARQMENAIAWLAPQFAGWTKT